MVQMQSSMEVADNSGAKRITVITVLGQRKTIARIGDIVTAAVNEAIKRVEDTNNSEMSKITGSMGLPGMF